MEVHAHSHTARKKWTHYLWEFLMLFLAVFCGFLAENIRETSIERHREKEFMHSMINDLKNDTTKLGKNIFAFQQILLEHDTLKKTYPLLAKGFNQVFYTHLNALTSYPDFIYTDGTIQQLKNSGGLRLIKNHTAVDSIMAYDAQVKKALINESILGVLANKMDDSRVEMFSAQNYDEAVLNGKTRAQMEAEQMEFLLSHDKVLLTKYYNKIRQYNWLSVIVKENMEELKSAADRLINVLQKEYHF